jgi:hypothetical protein
MKISSFVISLLFVSISCHANVDSYCDKPSSDATTVNFINNCGNDVSLFMMAKEYGRDKGVPRCLKNLSSKGGNGTVYLFPDKVGYAFYQAAGTDPGCSGPFNNPDKTCQKTRFEITVQVNSNIVSWDVSANDGWDLAMTVVAPKNTKGPALLVAKDANAPGIYPTPSVDAKCAVQPCASNAWDNDKPSEPFTVYLCNRAEDFHNTPGKCGCQQCPHGKDIECQQGMPNCTSSGSNIWCLTQCPADKTICTNVNWANLTEQQKEKCTELAQCPTPK